MGNPGWDRMRSVVRIAAPVLIQSLSAYALVFTDQVFVGQYRFEGLTAVANTIAPYFTLMSFFFALSAGVTILIAHARGAGRPVRARRIAESAFFFHFLISLGYLGFWLLFGRGVLALVGARGDILEMGSQFVTILAFQNLWQGLGFAAASLFQGLGKTFPLMVSALIKNALNILFAWIFIFGNAGFPAWGVPGSALATVLADGLGTLVLLVWVGRQRILPLGIRGILKPIGRVYRLVLRMGLPSGLEFSLWQAGQLGLVMMLNRVDPLLPGIFILVNTLTLFSVNLYIGLGNAALTLVGQATGARDNREALKVGVQTTVLSLGICLIIGLAFLLWPRPLLDLFSREGQVTNALLPFFGLVVGITFPKAVNVVIGSSIRGTGNTRWMLGTQTGGTIFILVLAGVLLFGFGGGLGALIWAVFWDETVRAAINFWKFVRGEASQERDLARLKKRP